MKAQHGYPTGPAPIFLPTIRVAATEWQVASPKAGDASMNRDEGQLTPMRYVSQRSTAGAL
jgi:hypothetical protein